MTSIERPTARSAAGIASVVETATPASRFNRPRTVRHLVKSDRNMKNFLS
jgi:hypothetical protein